MEVIEQTVRYPVCERYKRSGRSSVMQPYTPVIAGYLPPDM